VYEERHTGPKPAVFHEDDVEEVAFLREIRFVRCGGGRKEVEGRGEEERTGVDGGDDVFSGRGMEIW